MAKARQLLFNVEQVLFGVLDLFKVRQVIVEQFDGP